MVILPAPASWERRKASPVRAWAKAAAVLKAAHRAAVRVAAAQAAAAQLKQPFTLRPATQLLFTQPATRSKREPFS
jgi:hypothetical protein